jgi:hypothetical protein
MKISVLLPILLPAVVMAGTTRGATPDTLAEENHQRSLGFFKRLFRRRRDVHNALNNGAFQSPAPPYVAPTVEDSCVADADCSNEQTHYCTRDAGTCLPMGDCNVLSDCKSPSNIYVTVSCVGEKFCDQQRCGITCDGVDANPPNDEEPAGSCANITDCGENQYCAAGTCHDDDGTCSDGSQPVNCFVQPCKSDDCAEARYCVDDYCGGCNAYHFDAGNNQVCV